MLTRCLTWCCSTWIRFGLLTIDSAQEAVSNTLGSNSSNSGATPQDCNKPEAGAKAEACVWDGPRWDTDTDMPDAGAPHGSALQSGSDGKLLYSV